MSESLSSSAQRVQSALNEHNLELRVVELPGSTRTSQEAADTIGCEVSQIAKSIIFRGKESGTPILVIASGENRVSERKLKSIVGEKVEKPDAEFVLEETGYAIGGIPPVGHKNDIVTYIDEDLMDHKIIWAAAGTPNAVFSLTPQELLEITNGEIIDVQ
jgi:prolyl-tRNA editing enzyme YbaK/EbsC (Cys-tRNA(Pro) deacylase)